MYGEAQQDLRARLTKLPEEIRKYYAAYFSELRKELSRPDLFPKAIPDYLQGFKRVVSIGGKNGLIVAHFPVELEIKFSETETGKLLLRFPSVQNAENDEYEFITFPGSPVKDLVSLVSDREDISDVLPSEEKWTTDGVAGVFSRPLEQADLDTGQITWRASWTRLTFVNFGYVHFWEDTARARSEARKDTKPYIQDLEREELDAVVAPEDVGEASVRAGDSGVVIEKFGGPEPALLVEFTDSVGQTKALVTYSTNLKKIFDVFVDRDFIVHHAHTSDRVKSHYRELSHNFPSSSPVQRGLLVTA